MKALIPVVALFLSSCGPVYPGTVACTSKCGLRLLEPIQTPREGTGLSCDTLQEAEDNALMELAQASDPRMKLGCLVINGWSIMQWKEERVLVDQGRSYIAGATRCDIDLFMISNMSWRAGAFAHELAHAIQNCYAGGNDKSDPAHSNWHEDGIYSAIDRVNAGEAWEFKDE